MHHNIYLGIMINVMAKFLLQLRQSSWEIPWQQKNRKVTIPDSPAVWIRFEFQPYLILDTLTHVTMMVTGWLYTIIMSLKVEYTANVYLLIIILERKQNAMPVQCEYLTRRLRITIMLMAIRRSGNCNRISLSHGLSCDTTHNVTMTWEG